MVDGRNGSERNGSDPNKNWRQRPRKPDGSQALGEVIREQRLRRGMTQYDVADAMRNIGAKKTQASFISKIEEGKTKAPMPHMMAPLAEALGLPFPLLYEAATGIRLPDWDSLNLDPEVQAAAVWLQGLAPDRRRELLEIMREAEKNLG
jgi:transcriptional regulator with XRE-family HTH domain